MYTFDEKIIHDQKAMWSLGLSFKIKYEVWTKELAKLKTKDFCMNYDGELIFKCDDEKRFKKAVEDYKQRVRVLEKILTSDLNHSDSEHNKYITK